MESHEDLTRRIRRLERRQARTALPTMLLALVCFFALNVAYSDVPHSFAGNTVISASEMNDNFAALDTRLSAVEDYVTDQSAVAFTVITSHRSEGLHGTRRLPGAAPRRRRRLGRDLRRLRRPHGRHLLLLPGPHR